MREVVNVHIAEDQENRREALGKSVEKQKKKFEGNRESSKEIYIYSKIITIILTFMQCVPPLLGVVSVLHFVTNLNWYVLILLYENV